MKFAFCNEMFEARAMSEVCKTGKRLGYDGIEIAPFTLADSAEDVSVQQRKEVRRIVEEDAVGLPPVAAAAPRLLHVLLEGGG